MKDTNKTDQLTRRYLHRTVHLALLFLMQTGFSVYGLVLLMAIKAPGYLWAIWIPYQVIGWLFFVWQFISLAESNRETQKLYDEMKQSILDEISEVKGQ